MKKRTKCLVCTLAGIIFFSSISYAANTTTLYDVIASGIKIVLDGKTINPTDVNGNTVEPIIYNGTTYLPVRAVANAIGKAVYWDGPSFTVYLGDMNGSLEFPTVELLDMISINETPRSTDELTDNYGNTYNNAVHNWATNEYEYLLNMKYSRFKATLYVPRGTSGDSSGYLTIITDGKTIYKSPEMTSASAPVNIDVNVTGCNDVKIEFNGICNSSPFATSMCLGNAGFYQ